MNFRNLLMWGLIILLSVGLFNLFQNPDRTNTNNNQIAFSKFLQITKNKQNLLLAEPKTICRLFRGERAAEKCPR